MGRFLYSPSQTEVWEGGSKTIKTTTPGNYYFGGAAEGILAGRPRARLM
jgi:hypothetical protein